ncbi:MAG: helical backbone metal receptor [Acidimicrobiales bacterium]|jgi:ABC-type Fe3+-hydroxamate transport system substrate-binding protein
MDTLTGKEETVPTLDDGLGHPFTLERHPSRVISLVPSITEALATTVPGVLVGATDWCTHPPDLDVARVRGTKNPDHEAIARLRPDLVIANQEENRRVDVERMRAAGIPVWVTVIESVDQALASLHRLLAEVLGADEPGWLATATAEWRRPAELAPARVIVPIWRDPWMAVGPHTFCRDLVHRLGLTCLPTEGEDRYPKVDVAGLGGRGPDLVLLPDEPYPFGPDDGPEAFPGIPTALVSGRDLTWYGPSMATSRSTLSAAVSSALERE